MKESIIDTSVLDANDVYDANLGNVRGDGTGMLLLHEPLSCRFPDLSVLGAAGRLRDDAWTEPGRDLTGRGMNAEARRGANARDCGNLRS